MKASQPLALLRQLFTHKLEPGDRVELDGEVEPSGRIGYTLYGPGGEDDMKSRGLTPAVAHAPSDMGSVLFHVKGGDQFLLRDLLHHVDDLQFSLTQTRGGEYVFDLVGHRRDSAKRVDVRGGSLNAAIQVFYDEVGSRTYRENHARARDIGVMVEPGWYWAKSSPSALWCVGKVLRYNSISGPAGTTWHGNEVVPVGDLYKLGPRVEPPQGDDWEPPMVQTYRPPETHAQWPPAERRSGHVTVEQWNEQCPEGTPVRYWPIAGRPECHDTWTRSKAWEVAGGRERIVQLVGFTGGHSLDHIQKLAHLRQPEKDSDDV